MSEPMVLHVTLSDGRHVNVSVLACVELAKVEAINADLCAALEAVRHGRCWCGVGVGDPNYRGVHSSACEEAAAALRNAKARGES